MGPQQQPNDPAQIEFCRLLYDFAQSDQDPAVVQSLRLDVRKGDLVAVLSKVDPDGNRSDLVEVSCPRRSYWTPACAYLELLRPVGNPVAAIKNTPAGDSSRANSLTSTTSVPSALGQSVVAQPVPSTKLETFRRKLPEVPILLLGW